MPTLLDLFKSANAMYYGGRSLLALYHGSTLIWSGFELPIQEGANLKITQTYKAECVGGKLEVE